MTVKSSKILLLLCSFFWILVPCSRAQNTEGYFSYNKDLSYYQDYDSKNFLTGNWGGLRGRLNEFGITPIARYYTTVMGNPVGGKSKGVQYAGLLNAYLIFDLQKLVNIKRTKFIVSGSWASGRSLSEENIGNFFSVSNIFSGRTVRLYQLIIESDLVENVLRVAVGRMGIGDEFATSASFSKYISFAIDYNPVSLPLNDAGFLSNPLASWAARVRIKPTKNIQILAGAYNSNPGVGKGRANGVDFSFNDGVIFIAELGYMPNLDFGSKSLPGSYKFGAFYDTRKFDELSLEPEKQKGNYSLYWILEQTMYRETAEDNQGLTTWATLSISPDENINTFPFFVSGGFVYRGLLPNRNDDSTAFGFAYGSVSDELEDKDYELMLELTYIIQWVPWLQIQPDVQWIVHPGGSSDVPNAVVVGVQLTVDI